MSDTLHIPSPCSENWNNMTAEGVGRHCTVCSHIVIDFTGWEPADITAYLQTNARRRVCGRLRQNQLGIRQELSTPSFIIRQILHSSLSVIQKIAAIIILIFSVGTTGCTKPSTVPPDTEKSENVPVMMGLICLDPVEYDSTDNFDDSATGTSLPLNFPNAPASPLVPR